MASVYRRTWEGADGKVRVRWVAAYKDQDGNRHNKGFRQRKDAKAFLVLTEGEVARGVHTPESSSITVYEAAQLWLKRGELEGLERSTLRQYRNHVDRHIVPQIGSVKLARLSTPVVQAFPEKLLETRSRALSRKILASVKSIIGEAMRRGLVAQNAALTVAVDVKKRVFASWAIEQGFTPKRLQTLLGHSSIQMTFDTYGHLFPCLEDDHAKFAAGERQITAARAVAEAAE